MFGPVFQRELVRTGRRDWLWILRLLLIVLLPVFSCVPQIAALSAYDPGTVNRTLLLVSDGWLQLLVLVQLLFALVAPILTAGAIAEEKARGTLQLLLATRLTPWDILFDKLLGRTLPLSLVFLVNLPLVCLHAGVSEAGPLVVLALALLPVVVVLAGGMLGLLVSVRSRTTAQSVMTAVFVASVLVLAVEWPDSPLQCLSPLFVLRAIWGLNYPATIGDLNRSLPSPHPGVLAWRLGLFVAAWGSVIVLGLALASWRLRPAYLAQLESRGRKPNRRPWRARPAVGNDPLFWKECYVEGLSAQAGRSRLPLWLELAVVFLLWVSVTVVLCGESIGWRYERVLGTATVKPEPVPQFPFFLQGLTVAVAAAVLIGVRTSGAISVEKQRQTWETLLLTDLTPAELVRSKVRGILWAAWPYLAVSLLPALLMSWFGGPAAVFWPLFWAAAACLAASFMAAVGIFHSTQTATGLERILQTLVSGLGLLFLLSFAASLPCALLVLGTEWPWVANLGVVLAMLLVWWPLSVSAQSFLQHAERSLAPRHRRELLLARDRDTR
jgi:ABC-type transport system involved in multi-copper enzyme maturation permease subunit